MRQPIDASFHIVILGNGISGITCARYLRKFSNARITVISEETPYFYARTALMYLYMGQLNWQDLQPYEPWFWDKNQINLIYDRAESIHFHSRQVHFTRSRPLVYDILILATGSVPNIPAWECVDLKGIQGFYSFQDLELLQVNTKNVSKAVLVGGGLIGVELAEMLLSRNIQVTFLVRDSGFYRSVLPSEESALISAHLEAHGIQLKLETELTAILGEETGYVRGVQTNRKERIACNFLGITTGVRPNIDFLRGADLEINKGILVNESFQTNLAQVYAIGDCAEFRSPPEGAATIEQLWYTGQQHGKNLAHILTGKALQYERLPFYNSAKFFDIEYQTYGVVRSKTPADEVSLFWQHPELPKAIRINYDRASKVFKGINVIGLRFRHQTAHHWLVKKSKMPQVLKELARGNFDPEFSQRFEKEILKHYKD